MPRRIKEVYIEGQEKLAAGGIHDAAFDARALLSFVMEIPFRDIPLHYTDEVSEEQLTRYEELLERRIGGEPLQYITGEQEFMGLPFHVDRRVLIPRLDTEILAEMAIDYVDALLPPVRVLDLCCGSGAIGLSIAALARGGKPGAGDCYDAEREKDRRTQIKVVLSDISQDALDVAAENAKALKVSDMVRLVKSDLFDNIEQGSNQKDERGFDLIVCNPPYIRTDVIKTLDTEVRNHEPMIALDGGADGLVMYRMITDNAADYLAPAGCLMMEIGCDQADDVMKMLEAKFDSVCVAKDLAGLDRVVIARRRKEIS